MALHITDPKADRLARKLAEAAGETLTVAIVKSLEQRLSQFEQAERASEDARASELIAIAYRATGLQGEDKTARQLIDELYDENGLPI